MTYRGKSTWPEELVIILTNMWTAGKSASDIARVLHKSRNAVIGRVHRLDLPKRLTAKRLYTPKRKRGDGDIAMRMLSRKVSPPKPLPKPTPVLQEPRNVTLMDLTAFTCKYPTSGDGATTLFCGHVPQTGFVYCEAHCRIAYQPKPVLKPEQPRIAA